MDTSWGDVREGLGIDGEMKDRLDLGGNVIGRAFVDSAVAARPLVEVRRFQGPVLVVHGTKDESVPPSDATRYVEAIGPKARLAMIDGADHTYSSHAWERQVLALTGSFLAEAL